MSKARTAKLFNGIAHWYDFLNHFLSAGFDIYWRNRLVRLIPEKDTPLCIDLAAGTLDLSLALRNRLRIFRPRIVACDFSWNMLRAGKKKIADSDLFLVLADALDLPFSSDFADIITVAFGLRNMEDRSRFYEESYRVLKPGGSLYILEFGGARKKIWRGCYNFYLRWVLPIVGRLISRSPDAYRYLADSIGRFPLAAELTQELDLAGFREIGCFPMTGGIVWVHVARKGFSPDVCPDRQEEVPGG